MQFLRCVELSQGRVEGKRRCGMPRRMWLANIKDDCPLTTSSQSGFNVEGWCDWCLKHPLMQPNDRDYDDESTEITLIVHINPQT